MNVIVRSDLGARLAPESKGARQARVYGAIGGGRGSLGCGSVDRLGATDHGAADRGLLRSPGRGRLLARTLQAHEPRDLRGLNDLSAVTVVVLLVGYIGTDAPRIGWTLEARSAPYDRHPMERHDDDLLRFEAEGPWPLPAVEAGADDVEGHVDHDGARIWYAAYGRGSPVVLLHGGLGNAGNWGYQVPGLLRMRRRVIVIDSRGHGRSPSCRARTWRRSACP